MVWHIGPCLPASCLHFGFEWVGVSAPQVAELFVRLDMAKSKAEARRLIKGGGAKQDGQVITEETKLLVAGEFKTAEVMLSAGKKKHGIVELSQA